MFWYINLSLVRKSILSTSLLNNIRMEWKGKCKTYFMKFHYSFEITLNVCDQCLLKIKYPFQIKNKVNILCMNLSGLCNVRCNSLFLLLIPKSNTIANRKINFLEIKLTFSVKLSLPVILIIEFFSTVITEHYGQPQRKFWYIQWFKYGTSFLFLLGASKSLNSHLVH